jgi:hypothetical protein
MRVLICGDRNWRNFHCIAYTLSYFATKHNVEVVIEGEAKGADTLGRVAAERFGIPVLKFPALWDKHGKAAGPIRNRQMLTEGKPTLVLAFHNDIANSKGTKDMVKAAMKAGIDTRVFTEKGEVNVRVG